MTAPDSDTPAKTSDAPSRPALFPAGLRKAVFFAALSAILYLSLMPRKLVDESFSAELQSQDSRFHTASYLALGFLFLAAFARRGKTSVRLRAAVFAGFAAMGGVVEFLQSLPAIGRSASVSDAVHNAVGAAIGAFLTPAALLLP